MNQRQTIHMSIKRNDHIYTTFIFNERAYPFRSSGNGTTETFWHTTETQVVMMCPSGILQILFKRCLLKDLKIFIITIYKLRVAR